VPARFALARPRPRQSKGRTRHSDLLPGAAPIKAGTAQLEPIRHETSRSESRNPLTLSSAGHEADGLSVLGCTVHQTRYRSGCELVTAGRPLHRPGRAGPPPTAAAPMHCLDMRTRRTVQAVRCFNSKLVRFALHELRRDTPVKVGAEVVEDQQVAGAVPGPDLTSSEPGGRRCTRGRGRRAGPRRVHRLAPRFRRTVRLDVSENRSPWCTVHGRRPYTIVVAV
jgi:hypothetical protein